MRWGVRSVRCRPSEDDLIAATVVGLLAEPRNAWPDVPCKQMDSNPRTKS